MSAFWSAAALLTAVALAFVAVPLWQQRRRTGGWPLPATVAMLLVAPLAFGLYFQIRTWAPDPAQGDSPAARMVAQLVARLAQNPDDPAGWQRLGRSYMVLGDAARARDAYREAWARTREPDTELLLSFGEAQVLADRVALRGDARLLFDAVLEREPSNSKALWYGGLAAFESGQEELAQLRWSRLLELDPPEEVKRALRSEFGMTAPVGVRTAVPAAVAAAPAQDSVGGPTIRLRVRLGERAAAVPHGPGAALFIFARAPEGGPPVAVIREAASAAPGEFTLSDANGMIPGRSLGDFATLAVVARLSASGQPTQQSGDLYGEGIVEPRAGSVLELVIDQVVP